MARFIVIGRRHPIGGYLRMSVEAASIDEAIAAAQRRQSERGAALISFEVEAVLEGPGRWGRLLWGSIDYVPSSFLRG